MLQLLFSVALPLIQILFLYMIHKNIKALADESQQKAELAKSLKAFGKMVAEAKDILP